MENITISRYDFRDAVMKANDEWGNIGNRNDEQSETTNFMMGLHNILFGSLLEKTLFDKTEEEK